MVSASPIHVSDHAIERWLEAGARQARLDDAVLAETVREEIVASIPARTRAVIDAVGADVRVKIHAHGVMICLKRKSRAKPGFVVTSVVPVQTGSAGSTTFARADAWREARA